MKKMMLIDTWNLEKLESWFSYMAEQGWHLAELKRGKAIFEKGTAKKTKYGIDTFQINELKGQSKIDVNEQLGWQYIDSIGYIHIFREKEYVEAKEIYPDGIEHAQSLKILQRSHLIKTLGVTFSIAIIFWLQLNLFKNNLAGILLSDSNLLTVSLLLILGYFLMKMHFGVLYLANLGRRLKNGYQFRRDIVTNAKLMKMKIKNALLVFLATIVTIMGLVATSTGGFNPIPNEQIPIVKLSEILEGENYENIKYADARGDYFKEDSSILVPRQYQLRQRAEIDTNPSYNPSLWTKRYEVRFESIAKLLVSLLMQEERHLGTYERKDHPTIDELWTIEEDNLTSFIARVGKDVFVVEYWGIEPIDTLIQYSIK